MDVEQVPWKVDPEAHQLPIANQRIPQDQMPNGSNNGVPHVPCPGTIWYPIGKNCEAEGCTNLAYKVCDGTDYCFCKQLYKGCGKAACIDHLHINVSSGRGSGKNKSRSVPQYVVSYQCTIWTDPGCKRKADDAIGWQFILLFCPFLISMIVIPVAFLT